MKVILDAIIPREDFEVENQVANGSSTTRSNLAITDLKDGTFFFTAVKKPDFQRETNEWTGAKIVGLVESFINGDLIPAIILWRSPVNSYTYVIDGSHRLSALAAWVNNDYGDGAISKRFFDGIIPDEQLTIAERTRKLIRTKIGHFSDYELALTSPEKVSKQIVEKSKIIATQGLQLQWVEGDAQKAEESFFKINQNAAPINKSELRLLRSRKKPYGIAARAISRSGTGHKYWSSFTDENQTKVEEIAKEVNNILFAPPLKNPIKTLDLPIGGKLYSQQTLALILEFINITTDIDDENDSSDDDINGEATVKILQQVSKVAERINSTHPGSLGLHPAVYFYSLDGRYMPGSFMAVSYFIKDISKSSKKLKEFTEVRDKFEKLLIENRYISEQIIRKWRSASAGYPHLTDFYHYAIRSLGEGLSVDEVISSLGKGEYRYITRPTYDGTDVTSADFSSNAKSAIFMRDAIGKALQCSICKGYIHRNSITFDHVTRKQDGGTGSPENGELAHPYCNSTYKN